MTNFRVAQRSDAPVHARILVFRSFLSPRSDLHAASPVPTPRRTSSMIATRGQSVYLVARSGSSIIRIADRVASISRRNDNPLLHSVIAAIIMISIMTANPEILSDSSSRPAVSGHGKVRFLWAWSTEWRWRSSWFPQSYERCVQSYGAGNCPVLLNDGVPRDLLSHAVGDTFRLPRRILGYRHRRRLPSIAFARRGLSLWDFRSFRAPPLRVAAVAM